MKLILNLNSQKNSIDSNISIRSIELKKNHWKLKNTSLLQYKNLLESKS